MMRLTEIKSYKRSSFFFFVLLVTLYFSISNCSNTPKAPPLNEGELLAKKHCSTCHKYPEPEFIDRESWAKHVLPAMAPRLGIKVYMDDQYVNNPNAITAVTYDEWLKIVAFYKSKSPVTLKAAKSSITPMKDWAVFALKKPAAKMQMATTTLASFDTISNNIYTSDMLLNTVYQWSDKLVQQGISKFPSAAVDVKFNKNIKGDEHGIFTLIGSFDAHDLESGFLTDVDLKKFKKPSSAKNIASGLNRAVASVSADFNKDGLADWVVCEFGHNRGGLSLFTQTTSGTYNKTAIRTITGPINVTTGDFNNDGWPDVMCLFAQGDEGLWMFLNDHKGGFTTRNLLRFPPVYGSTSFQLVDFNNDGKLDVLYTCGDNSDYSRVLKPYHGVYIFLNEGNFKYKQAYFYPVNGATKAIAADFNGDGKLDIAAIAFFSDLKSNPAEGFTYFEQTKPMQFMPHNIPVNNDGRWICMDVKDYNHDGKPDIILGNFSFGFINQEGVKPNWDTKTPYIVLENVRK
nr:VCBS repeat-containing protein [Mucilaginibacter sp. L294]